MDYVQKQFDGNKTLLYAWFSAMYTRVDVLIWSDNESNDLPGIVSKMEDELQRVESFANRFDANSELSRINSTAYEQPFAISDELADVLADCLMYTAKTLGYFDITVNSANGFTKGVTHIALDRTNKSIRFLHPDLRLDLSGYIKGYALRAIRTLLQDEKLHNALINIGNSSVLAIGNHPYGMGWKVSLPEATKECILYNECLTTSGNKEHTQWPILQPQTRVAIASQAPVSVLTNDPATGEVLSTALYIANEEERQVILKQLYGKIVFTN